MDMLRRESRTFKLVYGNTQEKNIPKQISQCALFWTCVGIRVQDAAEKIFLAIVRIVAIPIIVGVGFMVGYRFGYLKSDYSPVMPYKHWPEIWTHRVWPGPIALALVALWYLGRGLVILTDKVATYQTLPLTIVAGVTFLILLALAFYRLRRSEFWEITRDYAKALYRKACPLIPIEGPPEAK